MSSIKPTDKAIKEYHDSLHLFAQHEAIHEGATETAFSHLLAVTAKPHGWTLIPKKTFKLKAGKYVIPDGTLQDGNFLRRGYWEAKDTADDLEDEVVKKRKKGYPLANTIFEDTRRAILYQNGAETERYDLTKAQQVADLLTRFYAFTEPDIEGFEHAVDEFQHRVPELATGLVEKIKEAHKKNKKFEEAFLNFFTLCQTALNPNIRTEAVDEMLVQHLLTERLFRKIFNDEEFTKRNVIAAEVETVIAALVSKSFSRSEFLKSLDKFYKAIEAAAETIDDFSEKQHFLNTVYERFFQGYSVKAADTHGIVYTPQPIVDFMCASVEEVLKTEFGLTLGSPGVNILDPCTGTGNFIVNLLRRVPKKDLERVYKEQLFANEVMLLPYYIAALNIEHTYMELKGEYEPFEGLCFVDTLDLAEAKQPSFEFFAEKNTERVQRQKKTSITVIIGNPPYNVGQLNENDNNKNRKYPHLDEKINKTYSKDSIATNKKALSDPYVKFFRWAVDRLMGLDGIVCFVTNNSFVDQIAFDGMRKHFLKDFTKIYHLHLEGNVRQNPNHTGTMYNVFGIQVGVGITVAIKSRKHTVHELFFHRIEKSLRKEAKYSWLDAHKINSGIAWELLRPDKKDTWLVPEHGNAFAEMPPLGSKQAKNDSYLSEAIFKNYSGGVKTNRDGVVYDFSATDLTARVQTFVEAYNAEVDRYKRKVGKVNIDDFVRCESVVWSESLKANLKRYRYADCNPKRIRPAVYRPFCKQFLFFDEVLNERRYQMPRIFPTPSEANVALCVTGIGAERPFATMATLVTPDLNFFGPGTVPQWFPFYVYDEDASNRHENITDWALAKYREQYQDKKITKWDIFHYVYGILHHPGYRTKYADNLKREFPRIPFAPDFRAFADAGKKLADLHLNYEEHEPYELQFVETPGEPLSYIVEKMKLSKDKTSLWVNKSLTLAGIPSEVFEYRLGNRSALDWIIDQYQVSIDSRSGIESDPNREDDPEYIVKLVGRVVAVSVETVQIVKGLPKDFGG